jgi:AcrR family transcriptional regulator
MARRQAPAWHLPTPGGSHPHVAEIQRSRLLSAAIRAVEELGYQNTSVAHITARARVSRRTFYELFADREGCLLAALEGVVGTIESEIAAVEVENLAWRERVRTGLWAILCFFDREPVLARACVVQALRGGPAVLQTRERTLARLTAVVDEGREESPRASECSTLTAEGLVGAAFAILYTRLLREDSEPLTGLLGELMGMIVLPYCGPKVARAEQHRTAPAAIPALAEKPGAVDRFAGDPLEGIPIRLTYRTMRVLECVVASPGSSNRQLGDAAGIADPGQISKLLARLERTGVLVNAARGRHEGEPNAWQLTPIGERVAHSIGSQPDESQHDEASA